VGGRQIIFCYEWLYARSATEMAAKIYGPLCVIPDCPDEPFELT